MAVYKRSYRGYSGQLTPAWSRFLIVTRSAYRGLFRSRLLTGFFIACLFPFLVTALLIYASHNTTLLAMLQVGGRRLFEIDGKFFSNYFASQVAFAFILTSVVGPGLISPDLANNGLVLYFARPFSRAEYVLGKAAVLALMLSYITWIPGLILFGMETSLSGWGWMVDNLYIAGAIFLGSGILIVVLSLLALALSAWVKWKPVAGALVLGVLFLGAGFGAAINAVMRTNKGSLIAVATLLNTVWNSLFRREASDGISVPEAWMGLIAFSAVCLWLLSRKLRAYEVVR